MSGKDVFLTQGLAIVKKAITADNSKEYKEALGLYEDALKRFVLAYKYEKSPRTKKIIQSRIEEYMARAEDIKKIIDQQKANDEAINPNPTLIGTTSSNATAADNTFLTLALGTVTEAIKADKNNDYEKALALYKDALMKFVQAIKYEKNPITKKAIEDRVAGYMKRAEDIKKFIDPHKDMSTTNATSTGIVSGEGTSAFLSQAVGIIKDAIEADNNAEYEKAYALYKQALERFLLAIKYETNSSKRKLIEDRVEGYMKRAEEIKKALES